MGFMASLKAQQALNAHNRGDLTKAKKLYEEALAKGLLEARPMLGYALLLIREGSFEKAMDLLVKAQKAPDLTPERKSQLYVDYAACCARTGKLDKGVRLLARQHEHTPTGLTYQTLGYLYVEQLADAEKPVATEETVVMLPPEDGVGDPEPAPEGLSVEEKQALLDQQWQDRLNTAEKLILESVEYDDEDPVCLDNMAQFLYRVRGDKEAAREWFLKAHKEKPGQIDSLWFLSRYDVEEGNPGAALEKLETALEGSFSPLNYASRKMVEDEIARLKTDMK